MKNFFEKFQCGFREGYSTQQCLIASKQKCKSSTDERKSFRVLLINLSKSFDCLPHVLLIAKFQAHGFT